ncbi:hypothetical protein OE749_07725 [Aestuariibacter sp. AA17]|uniref:Uncharacterized protein n=1 Tax=Fluctibacter corallii TaxID=2984329 RepID=A0ABT3A7B7_9ALTE|nr:hypothetical protein [Aestuariibacter sp. AA17]MCV2884580.1 hypothetical protein [Aestuariibacter sp. AA17]
MEDHYNMMRALRATLMPMLILAMASSTFAQTPETSDNTNEKPIEASWLDDMHRGIAESMDDSASWVDSFFDAEGVSAKERPKGEARIRLAWEPRTRDISEVEARLKVRYKLPKLENKVDLILSDYEDDQPETKLQAGRLNDISQDDRFNLALRFRKSADSGFSHRIGVGRRLQLFAKSRYRNNHALMDDLTLYWNASVSHYSEDKWGADSEFTFDYQLEGTNLFRFDSQFYFRDKTDNWLWQHSWQHFNHVDDKTAVVVGLYLEGNSRPHYKLDEYLTSARWRKNALREWLFFEVEPYVLWRRDEHFSASYGVALRVEAFFGD